MKSSRMKAAHTETGSSGGRRAVFDIVVHALHNPAHVKNLN